MISQPFTSQFASVFVGDDDYCGTPWRPHIIVGQGSILPYIQPVVLPVLPARGA